MKRIFIFLFIFLFFSIACGLTGQATQQSGDSAIETVVAKTMAAQPTNSPPPTLTSTQTSQPDVSTLTQSPTIITITPTSTITPTLTLVAPSVTFTPLGPKSNLGNPTWSTSFDTDKAGFYTESDDQIQFKVDKSGLWATATMKSKGWTGWSFQNRKASNFYLEGTFMVQTCGGKDQYGLAFRAPDYSSGYFFGVSCDGEFNLSTLNTDFSPIFDWTGSDAILSGSNQVNRLGVMVKGNHISLYINDKLVKEIDDDSYKNEGVFGVFIAANQTPGFTYKLDEIGYWNLEK